MKDLRKIIALFFIIFLIGTGIIIGSINKKLDDPKPVENTEISKDSTESEVKGKKTV